MDGHSQRSVEQAVHERVERAPARERFIIPMIELADVKAHRTTRQRRLVQRLVGAWSPPNRYRDRDRDRFLSSRSPPRPHEPDTLSRPIGSAWLPCGRVPSYGSDSPLRPAPSRQPIRLGSRRIPTPTPGQSRSTAAGRRPFVGLYQRRDAGRKGGEFHTPPEVAILLAKLVQPQPGHTVCGPACGSGSLLIRVGREVGSDNFSLFGQESNGSTWALCRMNMFLHGMDGARVEWCNTITGPKLLESDRLMKFDIVVANPRSPSTSGAATWPRPTGPPSRRSGTTSAT